MKHISLAVAIVLLPLIVSCRSTTVAPSSETAHVIGRATLLSYNSVLTSNKGITVTFENTSYSATTDDSGMYEFKNIPEGTYNIRFSKAGFGDVYWYGKSIQGGGNAPVYWTNYNAGTYNGGTVIMTQRSNLVTTLQTATIGDTDAYRPGYRPLKLTGSYIGTDTSLIAIFFSHHTNVSPVPGTFETYVIPYHNWGGGQSDPNIIFHPTSNTFDVVIDARLLWGDFHSGDSVYISGYGYSYQGGQGWNSAFGGDYYDEVHRTWVLSSTDQTPSTVLGIKLP